MDQKPSPTKPSRQSRSRMEKAHERLNTISGIMASVTALATLTIKFIESSLKIVSPDTARDVSVILLYGLISALLTLVIVIAVGIFKQPRRLIVILTGILGEIISLLRKVPKAVRRTIYFLLVFLVVYFIGSRLDLWYLVKAWYSGPLVDLASTIQEETFQTTTNLPWSNYGQDFGEVSAWGHRGVSNDKSNIENTFRRLSENEIKCVAWFLLADGSGSLEFDEEGQLTGPDPNFWKDYDAAIEIARKYEIGIIWVLIDFKFMLPGEEVNGAKIYGHADVIEDPAKRKNFLDRVLVPIAKRYPYESSIVGWILINEPDIAVREGHVSFGAIQNFTSEASKIIKDNTHRQPATVGYSDPESLLEYSGKNSDDLDFLIFHHYNEIHDVSEPPLFSRLRAHLKWATNKPIYIGEFDKDNPPISFDKFITWSRHQGYAGVWPWSFTGVPVVPKMKEDFSSFPAKIQDHRRECEMAVRDIGQNEDWLERLNAERLAKEAELNGKVNECFRNNRQNVRGLGNCRKWEGEVRGRLREIDRDIKIATNNLNLAKQSKSLNCPQEFWKSYKLKWARLLYPSKAP